MSKKLLSLCLLGTAVVYVLVTSRARAQTTFGSIVGTITDPSGAVVPDAQVTLTNLGTSDTRTMETESNGFYQFVNLVPGRYGVDVQKAGFKRTSRRPIILEVQSTLKIDLTLEVGQVTQTVQVKAETPLLQPETSSLGQVVDQRQVTDLPLNGRNAMNLAALSPSVVPQGGSMGNPLGTVTGWGNYQIGGGMANQSVEYMDGTPINIAYLNLPGLMPSQDSLQEFKVQTNNLSAEFGGTAGGVINFTTKSGTNSLHGSAWEFLRNKVLNANNFFSNAEGIERPAFTQNQYGFNVGGPVDIPHVYDGRNKTFFFYNYDGFRLRQGAPLTDTVPTAAQRTGDFSNLRDASGKVIPIYNPTTTVPTTGNPGYYTRQQVSCNGQLNVVCPGQIDHAASVLLNLYPLPNTPLNPATGLNYATDASVGGGNSQSVVRIDQNISDRQHLFGRFSYWGNTALPSCPFHNGACGDGTESMHTKNVILGDVFTLSPTTVLDLRYSHLRFAYGRTPPSAGYDLTQLGWPAALNSSVSFRTLPVPIISGYDPAGIFGTEGTGSTIVDRNDNDLVAGSLTHIRGAHTLKFGAEFLRTTFNYAQTNCPSGCFTFDSSFTSSDPFHPVGGDGFASFLLGDASGGNVDTPAKVAGRQFYPAVYVQDDWRATRRLTFNLGLRWEETEPWTERYDRLSFFSPDTPNPITEQAGLHYNGAIGLVNSPGHRSRYQTAPNYRQFSPRLGLAYQVASKTVLRAGYGISWVPNNVSWYNSPNLDVINDITTSFVSSMDGLTPYDHLANPFPDGILQPPGRDPSYQQRMFGGVFTEVRDHNPYGYMQQWNLNIQQQLGGNFLIDVAYAASKGTHLQRVLQLLDQLPDQYLSLGPSLYDQVPNPFYGLVPQGLLSGPTTYRAQLLRPYPQYFYVFQNGAGTGNSNYQSFQVKLQKRFSAGATLLVAYTNSKFITDTDTITAWLEGGGAAYPQNWNNLSADRSLSANDTPQRLVVSYLLDLPFGRGRKYLSNPSGFMNQVIGGWGVDGIATCQRGFPLHFTTLYNLTGSFGGGILGARPNVVGKTALSGSAESRLNEWFNTAAFSQPAAFTFGDASRTDPVLRSDGIANFDFAAFKDFPFGREGRVKLQFRGEFFNLFNHAQFGYPGQTLGLPTFGAVTYQANNPRLIQFALRLNY